MKDLPNIRRWPRHQVDLPVRIAAADEISGVIVPGLATEISRTGVAVYAGVDLQPGDLMEVEFEAPGQVRILGTVCSRSGYCFGLAFVALVSGAVDEHGGLAQPEAIAQAVGSQDKLAMILQRHAAFLRHKQIEIMRTRQELLKVRQIQHKIDLIQNLEIPPRRK